MAKSAGYVYVLHFHSSLGNERHQARHYIGWAANWCYRVKSHREGSSHARIMEVLFERGIGFDVVMVVKGDRQLERKIKKGGHYDRCCPVCGGHRFTDYREEAS